MQLFIDLTPRQAARVLEQALRARAILELEPRTLPDEQPVRGRLTGREGELLTFEIESGQPAAPLNAFVGAFCEAEMILSGELYNFTSCILDVAEKDDLLRLYLVIPEIIQVRNRRQFERTNATIASQVRVHTPVQPAPAIGLLANVSLDGLACNLPGTDLDSALALGEELRVTFELAGFDEQFEMPVILCNKQLTPDKQQLSLGMQFNVNPNDSAAQRTHQRLRAALYELMTNIADMDGAL